MTVDRQMGMGYGGKIRPLGVKPDGHTQKDTLTLPVQIVRRRLEKYQICTYLSPHNI